MAIFFYKQSILNIIILEKRKEKATVTDSEGTVSEMTANEIYDINKSNSEKFSKYYINASIEFEGTIEKVEKSYLRSSFYGNYSAIWLEEGWVVMIDQDSSEFLANTDLAELNTGDAIKVTGKILNAFDLEGGVYVEVVENAVELL